MESGQITNKEASRFYPELCELILKFFIFLIHNDFGTDVYVIFLY